MASDTSNLLVYGTWYCLPLAIAVSYAKHTFYFTLSLRNGVVPPSNVHQLEASAFEWRGSLPNHPSATISFARDGLVLQAQFFMVRFPIFLLEQGPPPLLPPSLQGTPSGRYPAHISLPMLLLTQGILIPSALGCTTLMTFPSHLR